MQPKNRGKHLTSIRAMAMDLWEEEVTERRTPGGLFEADAGGGEKEREVSAGEAGGDGRHLIDDVERRRKIRHGHRSSGRGTGGSNYGYPSPIL